MNAEQDIGTVKRYRVLKVFTTFRATSLSFALSRRLVSGWNPESSIVMHVSFKLDGCPLIGSSHHALLQSSIA